VDWHQVSARRRAWYETKIFIIARGCGANDKRIGEQLALHSQRKILKVHSKNKLQVMVPIHVERILIIRARENRSHFTTLAQIIASCTPRIIREWTYSE
jgi:hypothetical protein